MDLGSWRGRGGTMPPLFASAIYNLDFKQQSRYF